MKEAILGKVKEYLQTVYQTEVQIRTVTEIGKHSARDLKSFGYGKPYRIDFEVDGVSKSAVLETMSENPFGHDHFSDRAQILLWCHSVFDKLPKHVRSIDVGAFTKDQTLLSCGNAEEFFLLTEFVDGQEYASDLSRIASGNLILGDLDRCAALARYLAEIHKTKKDAPHLYTRRIRDLLGHGECIMGLIDNYPADDPIATPERLRAIEASCVEWRWKLKKMSHRLSQVHGDFHPWNILFREGQDFTVLDRSRGEWGEPADDVSSMLINYLFLALQKEGEWSGPFQELYTTFWTTYFEATGDTEIQTVIQPFFAWRGLVLANPIWYPNLATSIRMKLFNLIHTILGQNELDLQNPQQYLGG
jgi:hypothetical protein